ncbi:MAG: hypothetical protein EKK29_07040 [Hyphomicrobiales bacterium]|nr:MAG: hypothetical protein EKK29_07040 [Hyphomicrobiales bacterium]
MRYQNYADRVRVLNKRQDESLDYQTRELRAEKHRVMARKLYDEQGVIAAEARRRSESLDDGVFGLSRRRKEAASARPFREMRRAQR